MNRFSPDAVNVVAVKKQREQFVVVFRGRDRQEALRTLGRWAANPDLGFTWYDAAVLSQKIRLAVTTGD